MAATLSSKVPLRPSLAFALSTLLSIVAMLWVAGCARLPDYARPRLLDSQNQPFSLEGEFPYRTLTVADFRASRLPEAKQRHARHINAHSCIQIRATRDSRFNITGGRLEGAIIYFGTIRRITFEAVMIPECSWWNPDIPDERVDYVLQHEQIHFALMEIAARQLTRKARNIADTYVAVGSTVQEARSEVEAKVKSMARAAMDDILAEHTAFDNATSLRFDPDVQDRWRRRVEAELRQEALPY